MRKLTVLAFGAGYLAGTRAGTERYDKLIALGRSMVKRFEPFRANLTGVTGTRDSVHAQTWTNGSIVKDGSLERTLLEGDSPINEFLRQTKYRRAG